MFLFWRWSFAICHSPSLCCRLTFSWSFATFPRYPFINLQIFASSSSSTFPGLSFFVLVSLELLFGLGSFPPDSFGVYLLTTCRSDFSGLFSWPFLMASFCHRFSSPYLLALFISLCWSQLSITVSRRLFPFPFLNAASCVHFFASFLLY